MKNIELIKESNSEVYLIRNWLTPQETSIYFEKLYSEIKWQQESMRIFDKEINLPRLTAWYGDEELECVIPVLSVEWLA